VTRRKARVDHIACPWLIYAHCRAERA
jgi:hypothetical protein